jgi:ABC-type multidrug transport system fused ATPase/permease subunit
MKSENSEIESRKLWINLQRAFAILHPRDRKKLALVTIIQILFSFLDLLGVAIVGMVSALIIRGINSQGPGDRVGRLLEILHIENLTLKEQVLLLGITALLVLTAKTVFSVIVLRKTLFYLSRKSASISHGLISKLLNKPLTYINEEPSQERLFSVTTGVSNLTVGVFTNLVLIVSDTSLLVILLAGLVVVDPATSLVTFSGFLLIGAVLYYLLHTHASRVGIESSRLIIESNRQIIEIMQFFKESIVKSSRPYYAKKIKKSRDELAELDGEIKFLPNISKYVTELSIVIGITAISVFQFSQSDPERATAVLTIFMVASARIAPALMRLQQNAISLKTYIAAAEPTLKLSEELRSVDSLPLWENHFRDHHPEFVPKVEVTNVEYGYPGASSFALSGISFNMMPGTLTALVGPSGGGKSTLADLILGILKPDTGNITISGLETLEALRTWPGSIGYVPQTVFIADGSISENICLGFDVEEVPNQAIWEALDAAEIGDFVRTTQKKLNFQVGEGGSNLSGGQRQRIGIARALLTKPLLVILDEATSALDSETENRVAESINGLKGKCTLLVIAHRLSTVRLADQVCFISGGKIQDRGTFDEVKSRNMDFKNQASLMGL